MEDKVDKRINDIVERDPLKYALLLMGIYDGCRIDNCHEKVIMSNYCEEHYKEYFVEKERIKLPLKKKGSKTKSAAKGSPLRRLLRRFLIIEKIYKNII